MAVGGGVTVRLFDPVASPVADGDVEGVGVGAGVTVTVLVDGSDTELVVENVTEPVVENVRSADGEALAVEPGTMARSEYGGETTLSVTYVPLPLV